MRRHVSFTPRLNLVWILALLTILGWGILLIFTNLSNVLGSAPCIPKPYDDGQKYRLGIVIPFRDREQHLVVFVNMMDSFFRLVQQDYEIIVVEQADERSFNRARLLNIGYILEKNNFDYFCFHDVDMIPAEMCVDYSYPKKGARHLAHNVQKHNWEMRHWEYNGGIMCLTKRDFEKVNGFSNNYWGWGGEDDEFAVRLKRAKINIERPSHAYFYTLFLQHQGEDRSYWKENFEAFKNSTRQRNDVMKDGLTTLNFTLVETIQTDYYRRHKVELLPKDSLLYLPLANMSIWNDKNK
eukprot:TRINITY_DN3525_c1_g1_i1.p1 TRINITY_DN3525_c1_g1~~TRINITY_DN3525_c1_g1_i1.p1  ORF type:complete len:296 (-),score=33.36 TRINITY_DN3525_c1_g1_i1:9-896(-)